ncbi:MAG TPA: hypothetical protein VMU40_00625 [Steroidobacteraceae bacterium]|nr:hypothetical protein [Steroidobacteraceae bacterium]
MQGLRFARKAALVALASALLIGAQGSAFARGHGGGFHGGGFHGGGLGGFHGGGFRGYGGWHGGYGGWHGGYGGWHGGYGGGWGWAPGWGLGLGVYLGTLPWYYSTFWWDGVPYYYADNNYYLWDDGADAYEQVQPPPEVAQQAAVAPATPPELFAYPDKGQTAQQQAADKSQCSQWATAQTGFTPSSAGARVKDDPTESKENTLTEGAKRQGYLRAEGACLEARGYTVG